LGYLECKNKGYPDLHQVVSNVIMGEIIKNVFIVGAVGDISLVFFDFFLDKLLLSLKKY
jgi:hypothetical protein